MDPIHQGWLKKKDEFHDLLWTIFFLKVTRGWRKVSEGHDPSLLSPTTFTAQTLVERPMRIRRRTGTHRGNETRGREWSGTSLDLIHPKQSRNTRLTKPHSLQGSVVNSCLIIRMQRRFIMNTYSSTQVDSRGNTKRTGGQAPKEAVDMWRNNQHSLGKQLGGIQDGTRLRGC